MFFRGKTKSAVPRDVLEPSFFSAWKDAWRTASSRNSKQNHETHSSLGRDFGRQECPPELYALTGVSNTVRRRILANSFLRGWTKWWTWILTGLIVAGALSAKWTVAVILAAVLTVVGAVAVLVWVWWTRLSIYDAARRLDSIAGLYDRISTAIFLGDIKNPDEMLQRQRRDATARLGKVEPARLFPIRMPSTAGRALVLVLASAGLLAYRMHHKPPLITLLQTTARSEFVQSVLSPIVHAMEQDIQRTVALVTAKMEASADEVRAGQPLPQPGDDLWKNSDDKGKPAQDQQDSQGNGQGDQAQDQQQGSDQSATPSAEEQKQESNSPQQNASKSNTGNSEQQQKTQGNESNGQTLGQTLMQALKSMMSKPQNQPSNNRDNQAGQQKAQGSPQPGNSQEAGSSDSDKKNEGRGTSDAQQKASQSASNGAGSQEGLKDKRASTETHPVNAVPDRVALEATGLKEQTRMRALPDTGTAQLPTRDISPAAAAVINGAEQENIPARYRLYVQRYFEHADNGQR